MPIVTNPYVAGNPVGNSPAFVGREDVLREVLRVLRSESQNAITLPGSARLYRRRWSAAGRLGGPGVGDAVVAGGGADPGAAKAG